MTLYIPSKATNWMQPLFSVKREKDNNPYPINSERLVYFFTGRYALSAGLHVLGLNPGDKILLPAYNCWVEIESALSVGMEIQFYKIKSDLQIDIGHLESCIDESTKAVLITHYLGFPQPLNEIRKLCDIHGLYLVEDCAHAFLSDDKGVPVGKTGDISIFSFRKTLPIPDGGGLVLNVPKLRYFGKMKKPNGFSVAFVMAEYMKLLKRGHKFTGRALGNNILSNLVYWLIFGIRICLRGLRKISGYGARCLVYPSGNVYRGNLENWGISRISREILKKSNFDLIKMTRQRNFQLLLDYFQNDSRVNLPFGELKEGVCPLFFPIIIEHRDIFYNEIRKMGIVGHDWWKDFHPSVPWEQFPEASFLKRSILGLPVHQELDVADMERIISAFEELCIKIRL